MPLSPFASATPQNFYLGHGGVIAPTKNAPTNIDITSASLTGGALSADTTYVVGVAFVGWTGRTSILDLTAVTGSLTYPGFILSVDLTSGINGVSIYCDTIPSKLLGTITTIQDNSSWITGPIVYDSTTSGLRASISGHTLTVDILTTSVTQNSSPQFNNATLKMFTSPLNNANTPAPAATGILTSARFINGDSTSHTVSLWVVPVDYQGDTPGVERSLFYNYKVPGNTVINETSINIPLDGGSIIIGAYDGDTFVNLNDATSWPIGVVLSGVTIQ